MKNYLIFKVEIRFSDVSKIILFPSPGIEYYIFCRNCLLKDGYYHFYAKINFLSIN